MVAAVVRPPGVPHTVDVMLTAEDGMVLIGRGYGRERAVRIELDRAGALALAESITDILAAPIDRAQLATRDDVLAVQAALNSLRDEIRRPAPAPMPQPSFTSPPSS